MTVECANTARCGSDSLMENAGSIAEDGQQHVSRAACGVTLLRGIEEDCLDAITTHKAEVRESLGKPPLED